MAHDGQDLGHMTPVLLDNLLELTGEAIAPLESVLDTARDRVRTLVSAEGRVSSALVEQHQTAAHGLAWLATYVEALRQMQKWATTLDAQSKFGEVEALIHQIAFGEYLWQVYGGIQMNQGEVLRLQDMGLSQDDMRGMMAPAVMTLTQGGNTQAARMRLVELMQERSAEITVGASGLDEELEMIREQFRRYAVEKVEPFAHDW
ncbi:MAG: acyl-CoA dehydrogenase, partial [Pseudomonadota bacterium]